MSGSTRRVSWPLARCSTRMTSLLVTLRRTLLLKSISWIGTSSWLNRRQRLHTRSTRKRSGRYDRKEITSRSPTSLSATFACLLTIESSEDAGSAGGRRATSPNRLGKVAACTLCCPLAFFVEVLAFFERLAGGLVLRGFLLAVAGDLARPLDKPPEATAAADRLGGMRSLASIFKFPLWREVYPIHPNLWLKTDCGISVNKYDRTTS